MLRDVLDRLAVLQFALLFLPALIATLSIYGSEFELTSGRMIGGLVLWLSVQALITRRLARRVASSAAAWALVCVAAALAVTWAYRPLHFDWWNERSVPHAWSMVVIGTTSLLLSSCALERVRASGTTWSRGLGGALLLSALPWLAAQSHPNATFFGVALVAAAGLASGTLVGAPSDVSAQVSTRGPWLWAVALASIDLSLPVWERNLEGGFGAAVALALAAAGVASLMPRARAALVLIGGVSFLFTCALPDWALHPLHQVVAGAMLGAGLGGLELRARLLPLGGATLCIGAAWMIAHAVTQNLAFAAVRALLVLPAALVCWRVRRIARP